MNGRPVAEWTDLSPVTKATENKQPKNSTKKKKSVSSNEEVSDLFTGLVEKERLIKVYEKMTGDK